MHSVFSYGKGLLTVVQRMTVAVRVERAKGIEPS
jgi:hypothetical protein